MKVALIIDKPKRCYSCPCYFEGQCNATKEKIGVARSMVWLSPDCPLIALPMKRKSNIRWFDDMKEIMSYDITEYDKGWNDCVDTMIGENEYE